MMKIKVLIISLVSLMWGSLVFSQEQTDSTVLTQLQELKDHGEQNSDIRTQLQELKIQELELQNTVDSLGELLKLKRSQFEGNSQNSDSIGEQIIALEGSVFDYRSKLSILGSNIAALEARQSILDQQSGRTTTDSQVSASVKSLIESKLFVDNISSEDLQLFGRSSKIMGEFEANIDKVNTLYVELLALEEVYKATESQVVIDSVMKKAADIKREITQTDRLISQSWGELYNRKLDSYLVLIDHLTGIDRNLLEELDLLSRNAFAAQQQSGESLTPSIVSYIPQQKLLLEYETLFAQKLELKAIVDSLNKVNEGLSKKSLLSFDDINYPYRSTVIYGDITLGNTHSYSDITEVPELQLPPQGVYYAVQVALVSKLASSLSIFKGAEPLQVEKTSTGGSRYVLGGFKSYDKAAQAVKECFAAQFKNPVLVAWVDGKFSTVAKARAYQAANPEITPECDFKIEIRSSKADIASVIKKIIDINSAGKNISRIQQGSGFVYTIGTFITRDEAEIIAYIIGSECGEDAICEVKAIE